MLSTIQSLLMPVSFGLLLFLMLLYWIQVAFFSYTKYKKLNILVFYSSFFSLTSILGIRWIESGHFPLSNLYESLIFLSWSFLLSQLVFQWSEQSFDKATLLHKSGRHSVVFPHSKQNQIFTASHLNTESLDDFFGVVISPLALVSYGFAFLNLPKEMQKATSLVPALQSNWLMMHVTVMILSYAALICGSILSMAFLLVNWLSQIYHHKTVTESLQTSHRQFGDVADCQPCLAKQASWPLRSELSSDNTALLPPKRSSTSFVSSSRHQTPFQATADRLTPFYRTLLQTHTTDAADNSDAVQSSTCRVLDNLSYRMVTLGFPLLTLGILSGAVWAEAAWGSYWSWDPKETWALVTWLIFALYLHARFTRGWRGERAALIATFGFFVLSFCYFGVNLLGAGLHSYGWFVT